MSYRVPALFRNGLGSMLDRDLRVRKKAGKAAGASIVSVSGILKFGEWQDTTLEWTSSLYSRMPIRTAKLVWGMTLSDRPMI